jgi:hypothetical protein
MAAIMADDVLVIAARHERDRRAESYPKKIAEGRIDEIVAAVDHHAWVAIVEWLQTGRFRRFDGPPAVGWPELETAAKSAYEQICAKVDAIEADPDQAKVKPEKRLTSGQWIDRLTELYIRRARLRLIHIKVQLRRESVDIVNAELRARTPQEIAA